MKYIMSAVLIAMATASSAQEMAKGSMELNNSTAVGAKSSVTITAYVTNKSRTAVKDGAVGFDNEWDGCVATFGAIAPNGGTASSSCVLDGYALAAKVGFNAADGTGWYGIGGNGQAFEDFEINLNDAK